MFTIIYRGKTISYSKYNIHIKDSVLVRTAAEMEAILKFIVARAAKRGIEFKRSITSWVREWKAHNLLCDHNYKIERTSAVDLNENETLLKRIGYFILALFYKG